MHFQASVRGDRQELNKWLISGGDPNSRDEEGWALLHHASVSVGSYTERTRLLAAACLLPSTLSVYTPPGLRLRSTL